ncbi:MAG TPA: hypothetical protein VGK96_14410 [Candidatus Sulfotelmatobacter sp.]
MLLKSQLDSIIASGCHEIEMRVDESFRAPGALEVTKAWLCCGSMSAKIYCITIVMLIA